ncbi:MAG: right-handed parallel beta-helix repeat-containing protein [Pirellulales bacterium]|nr:right-handed parallel beta-helix repeat-containing protein [Pirellulales bacterium]
MRKQFASCCITIGSLATLLGLCVEFSAYGQPGVVTGKNTTRLPGARPVIEAADYPSLQAAIDALPNEGGLVRVPPGKFEITSPLIIVHGDVAIEGSGTATLIHNANEQGQPAFVLQGKKRNEKLWRIRLANLRLTGNPKSGDGISAARIQEIHIEGCTISNHGRHGVFLDDCYEDPRINDSILSYNQATGLHIVKCHDIVVCGNHFEENKDALKCLDSFNLCMSGNNLDDHLGDGVTIENTYGSIVSSNMIEECKGTGVLLDRDCYGISVSANVIAHNQNGGIELRDAHGCAVSANTFTINPRRAMVAGPGSSRITISANNFSDSVIDDAKEKRPPDDQAASGIVLDGTHDIVIAGNLFSGLDTPAIERTGSPCQGIRVQANSFVETDGSNDDE